MNTLLITNNMLVYERYKDNMDIVFKENFSYSDILYFTRDLIHKGYKLLTHPLAGSIKPNQTPFRTIILSYNKDDLDYESLKYIEDSIQTSRKFLNNKSTSNWGKSVLDDFRIIDLSLIESIIDSF